MLSFRCVTEVRLLVLPSEKMNYLIENKYRDKPFSRDMLILKNKLNKITRKYPCDYIVRMPQQMSGYLDEGSLWRNNCLKNVVMRVIDEIHEKRKRPKFADFISLYRDKKHEKGANRK